MGKAGVWGHRCVITLHSVEAIVLIRIFLDDPLRKNDGVMAGKNVWPDNSKVPGFREAVVSY